MTQEKLNETVTIAAQEKELDRLRALVAVAEEMAKLLSHLMRELQHCPGCGRHIWSYQPHDPTCLLSVALAKWEGAA